MFSDGGWQVEGITGICWTPWARFPDGLQRTLAKLARGRLDEFLYQQYAVVARSKT